VNGNAPQHWTAVIAKAAWTLLLAAVLVFISWQLLQQVLGVLLIGLGLLFVYRLALGWFRRDGW
jgi:hypothetical protein